MKQITEFAIVEKETKKCYLLNKGSTRIGRNNENNIKIKHSQCSKYHSTITTRGTIIHYHDFSNNGSEVLKRSGYHLLKNETTRIYENSKIRIANREFKIIKSKNIKNETEVISIDSDDDCEVNETIKEIERNDIDDNTIQPTCSNDKNDNKAYKWKSNLLHRSTMVPNENETDSDSETEKQIKIKEEFEQGLANIKEESDVDDFDFDLFNQ